jgi:hypothetical protein
MAFRPIPVNKLFAPPDLASKQKNKAGLIKAQKRTCLINGGLFISKKPTAFIQSIEKMRLQQDRI